MLKIIVLFTIIHICLANWHCGAYRVDTFLSQLICSPSSYSEDINRCCHIHDVDYDRIDGRKDCSPSNLYCAWDRKMSDETFCNCLRGIPSLYVKAVVVPTFCGVVNAWSFFRNFF